MKVNSRLFDTGAKMRDWIGDLGAIDADTTAAAAAVHDACR